MKSKPKAERWKCASASGVSSGLVCPLGTERSCSVSCCGASLVAAVAQDFGK